MSIKATMTVALLVSNSAFAQERPIAPMNPKSLEDCSVFQRQQVDYSKIALEKSKGCSKGQHASKSKSYVSFMPTCGGTKVTAYTACQSAFEASWCAWAGFGQNYKTCVEKVSGESRERKKLNDELKRQTERQNELRRALQSERCGTASVFPRADSQCKQTNAPRANDATRVPGLE